MSLRLVEHNPASVTASTSPAPAALRMRMAAKWCVDTLAGLLLLAVLAPLMLLVVLLIFLTMGAPVLFRQVRPGLHGRLFTICKFRTMTDARDAGGNLLPDEARTTAVGRLLRRLRLDELPQVFNLLRGEMSLVGPRPLLPEYLERFTPFEARRHSMRPGITGWAQINGSTTLNWREKMALDVWYVDHWTPWLDLLIIVRTLRVALCGDHIDSRVIATALEHAERAADEGTENRRQTTDD